MIVESLFKLYMVLIIVLILLMFWAALQIVVAEALWRSMRSFLEQVPGAAFGR